MCLVPVICHVVIMYNFFLVPVESKIQVTYNRRLRIEHCLDYCEVIKGVQVITKEEFYCYVMSQILIKFTVRNREFLIDT